MNFNFDKYNPENFDLFGEKIQQALTHDLPGDLSHLKMASQNRINEIKNSFDTSLATRSAVLVLFYLEENKVKLPFILRPQYDGVHANQVAFPGGRWEEDDQNLVETALREANEEVGIDYNSVKILGNLTQLYIPPSNYLVQPVVGITHQVPLFKAQPEEVEQIIEANLSFLFDKEFRQNKILNIRGKDMLTPTYLANGYTIWGATAMMLSELHDVIESLTETIQ